MKMLSQWLTTWNKFHLIRFQGRLLITRYNKIINGLVENFLWLFCGFRPFPFEEGSFFTVLLFFFSNTHFLVMCFICSIFLLSAVSSGEDIIFFSIFWVIFRWKPFIWYIRGSKILTLKWNGGENCKSSALKQKFVGSSVPSISISII